MQTLSVLVEDGYMQQFLNFVKQSHSNVTITQDKNLKLDPYFYERQNELHILRDEVKNGTMQMLSEDQYQKEIEDFFSQLEK